MKLNKSDLSKNLSVGEVAKRSGLAISAIHFYEAKGLIQSTRNQGNQRVFSRDVLRRLAIIKVAQQLGLSLEEIKFAFKDAPFDKTLSAADWKRMSKNWQAQLNARIYGLTQLRDHLTDCIGCGCLSLRECPLRNPKDKLAELGPGAHFKDLELDDEL